jgi:hypothetical protein
MPSKASVYYQHTLECLVFFKSQRSFRLVNDATMSPPWMLSVAAQGRLSKNRIHIKSEYFHICIASCQQTFPF